MSPLLELRNLSRHYRLAGQGLFARPQLLKAVDDVSLTVTAGRTLGLVGESGSGKTTTAKLALGLVPPSAGKVLFEGRPVPSRQGPAWRGLRQRMQMVYQDPLAALDRRIPVGQQVAEPLVVHDRGPSAAERRGRVLELFDAVGLGPDLYERYPHELSGGQRQRVVIARALIVEPALIVCDEPLSALDVSVAAQVINLLQDVQQRFGIGYLFISHNLNVVWQCADDVAVMYLGRIVEQGPADQLFREPAHPYTRALVSAVRSPRRRRQPRIILKGDPPNPAAIPPGCPFQTRCQEARPLCRELAPSLRAFGAGRMAACHFADAVPAVAA